METRVISKVWLIDSKGKLLLLRRSTTDERRPREWDIPGGHVDEYESPDTAAARETLEEAGIVIKESDLKLIYAMTEVPMKNVSATWLFYVAPVMNTGVVLSSEHEEYTWVTPKKAMEMIDYDRQKRALKYISENKLLSA